MDSRQTADERLAEPTGTDVVRARPPLSGFRSRMNRGLTNGRPTPPSLPANEVHRWRRSLGSLIRRVREDSLLRNSLFIMATTIVNSAFGFAFWLVAARLFPAHVVGLTAAVVSTGTIVVLLASLGVGGTLIQSLPARTKPSGWSLTFWAGMATAMTIGVVVGSASLLLLPLITQQLSVLHGASYGMIFAVGTLSMTAGAILDYVFIAERAAGNMLGRNSAVAAGKLLLVTLLTVAAGTSALKLLGAWAAASVVGLGLGIVLLTRSQDVTKPARPLALVREARKLQSRLAGNQLIGMGGALLPYLLPVMVTARLSSSENAYFYTTWMMAGIFLIIAPAVSQSLFAEGVHNPHELHVKVRSALTFIGTILVPGVVAIFAVGGVMLSAFGATYEHHAVGLLRIVLVASIPDAINNVYVAVLRVRGRLLAAAGLNLGMGIGIVTMSWILLPILGINAVGWSFLAMQLCGCAFVLLDSLRSSMLSRALRSADRREVR